ncbi:MAG: transketolase family protein [Clostridia bacterium]|jgi:transketolase|nr:transketolase family protein [Clostridia bacterium]
MTKIATRDAYGNALVKLGEVNQDVVVLDADLAGSTKTAKFREKYPERFFNMGIAEQNLIGTAAGFALSGKIPFASSFAIFATGRAFEQVRNSVAYPNLNVKIAATHAGLTVGEDGASHQALEDIAIMRAIPNMTVIVPADGVETEQAVFAAAKHQGPVYLRLGRPGVPVIYGEDYRFEIGKANLLRTGTQVGFVATGIMVSIALEAAEALKAEGIDAAVLNMSTIKPLDQEAIIQLAKTTGALVTAEEHNILGGLGSAVAEVVGEHCPVPVLRVGVKDVFGQSGTPAELLAEYGLTKENLMEKAKQAIAKKTC